MILGHRRREAEQWSRVKRGRVFNHHFHLNMIPRDVQALTFRIRNSKVRFANRRRGAMRGEHLALGRRWGDLDSRVGRGARGLSRCVARIA
jgi:hypothetical protein